MQSTRLQSNLNEFVLEADFNRLRRDNSKDLTTFVQWNSTGVTRNFLNFKSVMRNVFTCSKGFEQKASDEHDYKKLEILKTKAFQFER